MNCVNCGTYVDEYNEICMDCVHEDFLIFSDSEIEELKKMLQSQ